MPTAEEQPELLTVKETSEYLRIPLPTVYYLVKRGQLPAIQIGGRWRIKRSLLDRDVLKTVEESSATVLVVDDEPLMQNLFKQFLKKTGLGQVVVGRAADAISEMRRNKFDLVFLDLQLPDLSGDALYKRILEIDPDVPIVIITGYPDSEMLSRILADGPVTVVQKPIAPEILMKIVRPLLPKES